MFAVLVSTSITLFFFYLAVDFLGKQMIIPGSFYQLYWPPYLDFLLAFHFRLFHLPRSCDLSKLACLNKRYIIHVIHWSVFYCSRFTDLLALGVQPLRLVLLEVEMFLRYLWPILHALIFVHIDVYYKFFQAKHGFYLLPDICSNKSPWCRVIASRNSCTRIWLVLTQVVWWSQWGMNSFNKLDFFLCFYLLLSSNLNIWLLVA